MPIHIQDTVPGSPVEIPVSEKILRLDKIQRPELRQWYQPGQDLWYKNQSTIYSYVFVAKSYKITVTIKML